MPFPLTSAQAQLLNKMNSTTKKVDLGNAVRFDVIESSATVGGAASEALTFTGLAAADTIIVGGMRVAGSVTTVSMTGYNTQIANGLTVSFFANPGTGARVRILVLKAAV